MNRIAIQDEKSSLGAAAPVLAALKERMGKVFNFHGALANSPAVLQAFMEYDRLLDEGGTLSLQEKEAIALAAAQCNDSPYCLGVHSMISKMAGIAERDALAFREGTPGDPKLRALCGFVKKALESRGGVLAEDLQALRAAGYTDGQLVEIHAQLLKQVWTNYFTRAFGLELDVPPAPALASDAPAGAFVLTTVLSASPEAVYAAWLDSRGHSEMTGGKATVEPQVGGKHTAWDGYITGAILELAPNRRIVQSWRTGEFPKDAPDSRLEIRLDPVSGGTQLTLVHERVPARQTEMYRKGWQEHYFEPMKRHFSNRKGTH